MVGVGCSCGSYRADPPAGFNGNAQAIYPWGDGVGFTAGEAQQEQLQRSGPRGQVVGRSKRKIRLTPFSLVPVASAGAALPDR